MPLAEERFRTGNNVRIFLQGTDIKLGLGTIGPRGGALGEGTSLGMSIETGAQYVRVIGNPKPVDIVDGGYSFQINLDTVTVRDQEAADLINSSRVRIEEVDRNGNVCAVAEHCQLTGKRLQLAANQLMAGSLSFLALDARA